jgi:PTH1 family peptidyl-tRNA hydrolase
MAVDEIAARCGVKLGKHKRAVAEVAETHLAGTKVVLVKPMSFMNTSGGPVKALADFYKVDNDHIVVLHDELDIAPGTIRVKRGGGDNGHNGLKSIRSALGTGEWFRVRLGIGRPQGRQDPADFVLRAFSPKEESGLLAVLGADAAETLVRDGLEAAQNAFNS